MKLLEVDELSVGYGGALCLKSVSISVPKGGVVTIIGPNGAGKSTLLRTIAGLKRASSGRIWFEKHQLTVMSPASIVKLRIKLCPQEKCLFRSMSVYENLVLGGYVREFRSIRKADLDNIYQLFPILEKRSKQRAGSLSGGEQQMLSFGRALMGKPKFLMLDEPTLGLAPLMVREIANTMSSVSRGGVSILLAEQNVAMALKVSQYSYVLRLGQIGLEGSSADLIGNKSVQEEYLGVYKQRM
jgi:branched-chain amino acid transport system ATP-binding protein